MKVTGASGESSPADFEAFVYAHQETLLRFAYALTGDTFVAQDLVQTALVRLLVHWRKVADQEPLRYARRVIVNANHDLWRRSSRAISRQPLMHGLPHVDRTTALADRDAIILALGELTAREREVIVMRFVLDLDDAQISLELGVRSGTIRSTAHRALGKLRRSAHLLPDGTECNSNGAKSDH